MDRASARRTARHRRHIAAAIALSKQTAAEAELVAEADDNGTEIGDLHEDLPPRFQRLKQVFKTSYMRRIKSRGEKSAAPMPNRRLGLAVMSPLSEDKLVSFLAEIQSDIRQIKSDLQELLTLLKQQEKATAPSSDGDHIAEPAESGRSASPEDVLRYLRETRGEDDMAE